MFPDPSQTFDNLLGLEWLERAPERARARFVVRPELCDAQGQLHAGAISAVAETIASVAGSHAVLANGQVAIGMSNSATFFEQVRSGPVDVSGRLHHASDSEQVWDIEFHDDRERLCASVRVVLAVRSFSS